MSRTDGTPARQAFFASTNRRIVAALVSVTLVFGYLAYRNNTSADAAVRAVAGVAANVRRIDQVAHAVAVNTYNQCLRLAAASTKLNTSTNAIIRLLNAGPPSDMLSKYLDILRTSVLTVPECGSAP